MADEPEPAAEPESATVAAAAPAQPAPVAQDDGKSERVAAIVRNGLSNCAISQSVEAWRALETRLPEIVAAIIKEV